MISVGGGNITALMYFFTVIVASPIQSSSGTFALSFKDPSKSLALGKSWPLHMLFEQRWDRRTTSRSRYRVFVDQTCKIVCPT